MRTVTQTNPALPAGPKGRWLIGSLPMLRGDGLARIEGWAREYGGIFYCRALKIGFCLISKPDLIEDVLVTQSHNFIHGLALVSNRRFLGNGLLTSEGELWRRQRYLMQPAFHRRSIGRYAEVMVQHTQETMAAWRSGESHDLYSDMTRLTLEIVTRVLFDVDIDGHLDRVMAAARAGQLRNSRGIAPTYALKYFPTPRNLRYLWATHRLDQVIYRIIGQRRANGQLGADLLSMLLQARDEDGRPMSDRQVRDEVVTLIFTGSETVALTLSYAWYLLAQHPEVQAGLADELGEVLGGRTPTLEDLPKLTYTEKIIKEALRLYPPVWAFVREAVRPVEIGGYTLPAKTTLVLSQGLFTEISASMINRTSSVRSDGRRNSKSNCRSSRTFPSEAASGPALALLSRRWKQRWFWPRWHRDFICPWRRGLNSSSCPASLCSQSVAFPWCWPGGAGTGDLPLVKPLVRPVRIEEASPFHVPRSGTT